MADRIKGITVELNGDTTGLSKALSGVNKQIGSTQTELKDVEKLLKLDPKNTVLLQQKQELLAKAIGDTSDKLTTLKQASEKAAATAKNYDAWKEAYDPIQSEIDETRKKLSDLKEEQKAAADIHGVDSSEYKKLQESISETAQKLRDLKEAAKKVSDEFGNPISPKQYNALQREIIATESDLSGLRAESKKTDDAIREIKDDSLKNVADAAEKAKKNLKDAGNEASNFGDYLKASAIVEGAKSIVDSLKSVSEETKEYQKIMGSLEISSEAAGYSATQTAITYKQLYGVLADDQTAATTTANLQALGLAQWKLNDITSATIGAWSRYGDSIPIDGLAESINETVRAGSVTGTFADVLNWGSEEGETFGVMLKENTEANKAWNEAVESAETAEDYFNLALQECGSNAERANLIMQAMASQGLTEAGEKWKEQNEVLVESNEAQAEMQEQLAQLGETIMPFVTQITELVTQLLEKFNGLDASQQKLILTIIAVVAAISPIMGIFGNVSSGVTGITGLFGKLSGTTLPAVGKAFSGLFGIISANPVILIIAGIVAAVVALATLIFAYSDEIQYYLEQFNQWLQGIFAKDWEEVFGPVLGGFLNSFFEQLKSIWDSIYMIFNGVIDFICGIFTGDWERAWNGVKNIFAGIFDGLVAIAKTPINGIISLLNGAIGAINKLIVGFNSIGFDMPKWLGGGSWHPNIPTIGKIPLLAKGGILSSGSAVVGEAGPELLTMIGNKAMVQPLTSQTRTANFGATNIYVYGAQGQDVNELAEIVSDKLSREIERREAAFG